ncbi:MAG: hypothetical protein IJM92_01570 [Fibrobacter sp.]|uniref:hypothetical protein n=1 Tax=Fibrobacter sp. TaxID=35828 RepID=UPI0025BA6960|nr:hypothetical protein [Fibrobacter sp.]MBQ7078364.1 hypothetical protein [Fibrobacter sp.]
MRIVICVFLIALNAHAFFVGGKIGDSRLVSENVIYKPAGIIGLALESGFFNEPENMVDYSLAVELKRFGYSFNDGDNSVAFWSIGIKPMVWTISYWNMYVQGYLSFAFIFLHDEFRDDMEKKFLNGFNSHRFYLGGGWTIGYRVNDKLNVGLSYDIDRTFIHEKENWRHGNLFYQMGCLGISVQYNLF